MRLQVYSTKVSTGSTPKSSVGLNSALMAEENPWGYFCSIPICLEDAYCVGGRRTIELSGSPDYGV